MLLGSPPDMVHGGSVAQDPHIRMTKHQLVMSLRGAYYTILFSKRQAFFLLCAENLSKGLFARLFSIIIRKV